ncbi:TetR/AcrR family transcriptional regulator [Amycolatopsis rhabdoformis]|uniref:TetR/AcrR family transcriptional regulator n=1 Tax=Amycolatopsis rhabdoformis TaxID=1448059 RepID=A0ABZ1IDV8_9PSEU|nr:TetR/AcrR family transcriptional regulator [Amycolatopsis rhabdoformis]WSE32452.1 TetR/AcrR family transcriptional regulator [Amycolatopsis rhabdoformis]
MTEASPRQRGRPRKGTAPASVDRILAAALHAFAVHGYDGVSIRDLNRELGVSHNVVHQRFGSKDRLWYAAVDWGFGNAVAEVAAADLPGADPRTRLRTMIRTFVGFSARNPDLGSVISNEARRPGERLEYLLDHFVRPMLAAFTPAYEELPTRVPLPTLYYLITTGGAAPFTNEGMTRRLFGDDPFEQEAIDRHADAISELLVGQG